MKRDAAAAAFREAAHHDPEAVAFAPGRVNLIGEHTDYNEGFVLPAAVDRGVAVAGRRVPGDSFTLHAVDLGAHCTFSRLAPERDPGHSWADYFKGVVWALSKRGIDVPACEAAITGDIPRGAGLSSSAAYEVATALLLSTLGGFELPSLEVAKLAREAENGFVGVACGIMDQMAATFGEQGKALLIDCRSLAHEAVEIPPGLRIVVANSGVHHELASSRVQQTPRRMRGRACGSWPHLGPGIRALRDVTPDDEARFFERLPPVVRKRCLHVVSENARVLEGQSRRCVRHADTGPAQES